jgi:lipopolysaccharide/colanic/teichoic acid biosynthesis glycosyltransferase
MPLASVLAERRDMSPLLRRAVDLLVVTLVGPFAGILILLLGLVVRVTSPGPAFVFLERKGRGGRPFRMLKLRTMVRNAAQMQSELQHLNVLQGPAFKIPNDPRVTNVGRWLRKSSLDELPQLWNVLRGEMTLVGPRPSDVPLEKYQLWQTERLEVTPGLFGRWQAEGRGRVDFDTRCRMDISQVRSRSIVATLRWVALTTRGLLTARGAY